MKPIFTVLAALILLSLGAAPSLAQHFDGYDDEYYDGYEEGYTCWACPVCGFLIQLDVPVDESAIEYQTTLGEVMYLNPYDPDHYCPYCGAFGAYFVLVPCSDYYEYEEDYEEYEDEEYYEEYEDGEYCEADYEIEECKEVEEHSETFEEYEETEYVGTDEECEEYVEEITDNETEVAAEPVVGEEETPDFTEAAISDLDQNQSADANISEEAGKILIVLPPRDFNDVECNASTTRFLDEGFEVQVASKGTEEAVGMDGSSVAVDIEVADAEVADYEAVVFIGGPGVDDLLLYEDLEYLKLASSTRDQETIVGAICVAPKILANAWLLDGKNATVFPDSESVDYIKSRGAIPSQEEVVRDGNIITASRPEASEAFAEAVVAAVKENQA